MGLRSKLILLYVLLAIIPALTVGFLSYRISYNALWKNTVHSTMQIADQLNASIESLFKDTERFIDIGKSDYVQNYISGKGDSYQNAKQILALFDIYRKNFPFSGSVESIYVMGANGRAISESKGIFKLDNSGDSAQTLAKSFERSREVQIVTGNIHNEVEKSAQYIYIGQTLSLPALRDPFLHGYCRTEQQRDRELLRVGRHCGFGIFHHI